MAPDSARSMPPFLAGPLPLPQSSVTTSAAGVEALVQKVNSAISGELGAFACIAWGCAHCTFLAPLRTMHVQAHLKACIDSRH